MEAACWLSLGIMGDLHKWKDYNEGNNNKKHTSFWLNPEPKADSKS